MLSFLNDRFIPEQELMLPAQDLSIQRGYGLFDFFKTINNKPVFLDDHLDRFFYSAGQLFLPVPYTREQLKQILEELIAQNKIGDSGIRLTLTGGNSEDGYQPGKPNLFITQRPLTIRPEMVTTPYRLITYPYLRPLPSVKSIDYLMAVWLQEKCMKEKADDVLYLHGDQVLECPRSNVFIVRSDEVVLTPKDNILPGITRNKLVASLKRNYRVLEQDISISDLQEAKEVFITSTTKIVLPVTAVDNREYKGHQMAATCFRLLKDEFASSMM